MVFMGEMMTCIMSGKKKRSHPDIESGWDCIVVGSDKYYVSAGWREASYKRVGISETYMLIVKKIKELQQA